MNSVITCYKRIMLSAIIVGSLGINSVAVAVCSPCQAAAAAREAARQAAAAAREAAQAATAQSSLLVNKPVVREVELDEEDPLTMAVMQACCSYCAETGQYCGGENSARCTTCQEGLIKQSIADALAATLAAVTIIVKKKEFAQNISRAPRECIPTACDDCSSVTDDPICGLTSLLQGLIDSEAECCAVINAKLDAQGKAAGKCCRKVKHELDDIEELVESQIEQSAECCSVIESMLTSVLDQQAACCSLVDSTLISVLDQQAACCSLVDSTLISVQDQQAACCSLIDSTLTSIIDQSDACCSALEIQIINLSLSVTDIVVTLQSVLDICLG